MIEMQQMPAPVGEERDADGRLVAMHFEGDVVRGATSGSVWLVAVDGSAHSLRATAEALRQARAMTHCDIDLVNVQPWLAKEAAETELAPRGWADTFEARTLLDEAGQSWRLHVLMGKVAERIVALTDALGSRGIVVGHGQGTMQTLLLGSVTQRVLQLAAVPVLVVR